MSATASLQRALVTCCNGLARSVQVAVLLLALAMLASLSLQVLMRYVFNQAPTWTEEFAVTCFSWCMLLSIGLGVRNAIHVRMDLLVDRLPAPLRQGADRLVALAVALSGGFIAWHGVLYVMDAGGSRSAAMGYPLAWLYASAPVCGALMAAFGTELLLRGPLAAPTPNP